MSPTHGRDEAVAAGFELTPDAIAVFDGPDLVCRAANEAARQLLERDIVGLPVREAMAGLDVQELLDLYESVLATGEPVDARGLRLQLALPDAGLRELYVDVALVPWRRTDGSVRGLVARSAVVTARVERDRLSEEWTASTRADAVDARSRVTEIQDALLPKALPVAPGLDVAARYLLAQDGTSAGGDWFDAVIRPDGRVALVVGDVVGHGVEASATMGQLRAVLHTRLGDGTEAAHEVLVALDRIARADELTRGATVGLLEVDPRTGSAVHCAAGHPPPLVVAPDGDARFLPPVASTPLGVGGQVGGPSELTLGAGDLVLLYTDGILERPDTTPAAATVALARAASGAVRRKAALGTRLARATERVCELSLELLTRVTGHNDDITLLAAQMVPRPATLLAFRPALPASAREVRREVGDWLAGIDVTGPDAVAAQHAVGELVANVIRHAYAADDRAADDAVAVGAELGDDGAITFTVADHGTWKEPVHEPTSGGRGLAMAAAFTDDLRIEHGPSGGTTATLRLVPGRPATMVTSSPVSAHERRVAGPPFSADVVASSVQVAGAVDALATERLRLVLNRATAGGTRSITVDLSAVTHLGSGAVQLLHGRSAVELVAPMGSVAQHVLDVVGLPYRTS